MGSPHEGFFLAACPAVVIGRQGAVHSEDTRNEDISGHKLSMKVLANSAIQK